MYNGIGLQTARGSGTNGYIQSNKFFVKPKSNKLLNTNNNAYESSPGTKKPNKEILEHDRKRQIQLKLVVLEDKLIDQGYTDDEIAEKLDEARKTLESAMASDDAGGSTTIVMNPDHKFSDTQTHQVAARKEKQMENLKNALGIVHKEDIKKYVHVSDDEKIDDGDKAINLKKTDPGFDKKLVKDTKLGKDGLDELKQYKKKTNKRREVSSSESDSSSDSDSDSSREPVKATKKKQHKRRERSDTESESGSDSEADSDIDRRNNKRKSSSNHNKSRRHDSDDSRDTKKHIRNVKRYQSESDGSSTSDERPNITSGKGKQLSSRSKRHDSDDDSDAYDADKYGRRQLEDKRKDKRMESKVEKKKSTPGDYGRGIKDRWDGGSSKRDVLRDSSPVREQIHDKNRLERVGRNHDTDDEESDKDMYYKKQEVKRGRRNEEPNKKDIKAGEKSHIEEHKQERGESGRRRHDSDDDDDDLDVRRTKEEVDRHGRRQRDVELEVFNEKQIRTGETWQRDIKEHKKERVESRGRRHDSDDDGHGIDVRCTKGEVGRHGRRQHVVEPEAFHKKEIGTGEKRQCDIEEQKKERVEIGGRRHDSDDEDDKDARRTKAKVDKDGRRQPDVNREESSKEIRTGGTRQHDIKEDKKERVESGGRRRHDTDDDGDSDLDVRHIKEKVGRGGKRQEEDHHERKMRIPTRDEQRHKSNSDDEDEKYSESRKEIRDEEDRQGRKHKRDEEDETYKKPEKGREHRESMYSREHEEEHGSRRGERDRHVDHSKRTRYDSERRHDGGRSRH